MEEERLYPPRFVIGVSGRHATEARNITINFTGAREDLQTELFLEPIVPQGIILFTVMILYMKCILCNLLASNRPEASFMYYEDYSNEP